MTELQATELLQDVENVRVLLWHGVRALYWVAGLLFCIIILARAEI